MKIILNICFSFLILTSLFAQERVINAHTDRLSVINGWNWLSFPRMERFGNDYSPTIPVLERLSVFPYDLEMHYENFNFVNFIEFDMATMVWSGDLNDLQTTKGYKLDIDHPMETWDGYKSAPTGTDNYLVYNPGNGKKENRLMYAGENTHYQLVSLKQGEEFETPGMVSGVKCSPNPFTTETLISFRLGVATDINLSIYDINGRKVKTLVKGQQPGGYFEINWKGDNDSGNRVKKGVYFYRLGTSDGTVVTDKIVIL